MRKGTLEYPDGEIYDGDFQDGKKCGKGQLLLTDGTY